MKTLPWKQNGIKGFTREDGTWQCTGSQMGRRNIIPADYAGEKLKLRRVPFLDGGYDAGGAYWGTPANLWCAWGETATEQMEVFVRATDRDDAKLAVRKILPVKPRFHS